MSSLMCVWINGWVNNREAGDMRRYPAHYDVIVICNEDSDNVGPTNISVCGKGWGGGGGGGGWS